MRQAELIEALRRVRGWLPDPEAWALHEAVRRWRPERSVLTVVEIGSWQGRSTVVLASALRARGGGIVYAVDPHRETRLHSATGVADTFDAFLANVRAAGLADHVRAVRALSVEARASLADASVDALYVDGSHLYEDVLTDLDAWTSALADVALVAFHDARDEPGVERVLREQVEPEESPFYVLRAIDNLLLAEFRRPAQAAERTSAESIARRST